MKKSFYIKERHNPQFDKPYYVPQGQLSKAEAKRKEKSLYGDNIMLEYKTFEEYVEAQNKFKKEGFSVH